MLLLNDADEKWCCPNRTIYDVQLLDIWWFAEISEDFDNVGLIIGNSSQELQSILVTLDSTVDVIEEAIEKANKLYRKIIDQEKIKAQMAKKNDLYWSKSPSG